MPPRTAWAMRQIANSAVHPSRSTNSSSRVTSLYQSCCVPHSDPPLHNSMFRSRRLQPMPSPPSPPPNAPFTVLWFTDCHKSYFVIKAPNRVRRCGSGEREGKKTLKTKSTFLRNTWKKKMAANSSPVTLLLSVWSLVFVSETSLCVLSRRVGSCLNYSAAAFSALCVNTKNSTVTSFVPLQIVEKKKKEIRMKIFL